MKKIILFLCFFSITTSAFAGGFLYKFSSGNPTYWENQTNIVVAPESGSCGDYSNAEMVQILQEVLDEWQDTSEVNLGFSISQNQIGEISAENYIEAYTGTAVSCGNATGAARASQCSPSNNPSSTYADHNPIIFDNDGEIHEELYGCENLGLYLGATNINAANSAGQISRASFILNCACFTETPTTCQVGGSEFNPCTSVFPNGFSETVLRAVLQHEMGHFLNLDHTPLNGELLTDSNSSNDSDVPVMFPSLESPERVVSLKQDDKIALAQMYPSNSFANDYCVFTGTVVDRDDDQNELQCAAISANHNDPSQSVGFVSGALAPATDLNDDNDTVDFNESANRFESSSDRGEFKLYLKPDESYEITMAHINAAFVDSGQVYPCKNEQLPECTQAHIDSCYDESNREACDNGESSCVPCTPCVADQTLLTQSAYDSTFKSQCTGGATIDLGTFQTSSISFETAVNINGGVVGSELSNNDSPDDDNNDTDNNDSANGDNASSDGVTSGACQLVKNSSSKNATIFYFGLATALLAIVLTRRKKIS